MAVALSSRLGQAVVRMAGSPLFARIGPRVVPKVDRLLHRVTGGRVISSGALIPSLMLEVRGAKSGQLRQTPLATMPKDGSWYVVGSNFGREQHPVWTVNLAANPDAEITYRGEKIRVHAHRLSEEEKEAVWPELNRTWPNFDVYTARSGRNLRVFRLDRRDDPT
jgi:deazaflavin-dependent oxidoreductase (nitroreductase family)